MSQAQYPDAYMTMYADKPASKTPKDVYYAMVARIDGSMCRVCLKCGEKSVTQAAYERHHGIRPNAQFPKRSVEIHYLDDVLPPGATEFDMQALASVWPPPSEFLDSSSARIDALSIDFLTSDNDTYVGRAQEAAPSSASVALPLATQAPARASA